MSHLTIHLEQPVATINPNIYGHLRNTWAAASTTARVGLASPIPNTDGWRNDVVEALRRMQAPVIRWPGGCFADDYHRQDGIGPRESRLPHQHPLGGGRGVVERGRHAGVRALLPARRCGPVLLRQRRLRHGPRAARTGWNTRNFPGDSTWARQCRGRQPDPLDIAYWWASATRTGAAAAASRRRTTRSSGAMPRSCGPSAARNSPSSPAAPGTTTSNGRPVSSASCARTWDFNNIHGFAAHYYCGTPRPASSTTDQWYQLIGRGWRWSRRTCSSGPRWTHMTRSAASA